MQNLTPGFKNHIRNLNNFRQSVESPKSGNFMSFCPKNKFLHLKNYQRIYLTILSTTCVKIHQTAYVNFHDTTPLYLFSSNIMAYILQKQLIKVKIFLLSLAQVKVHQIPYFIFQIKSQFSFKDIFFIVMSDHSLVVFQLKLYMLLRKVAHERANFQVCHCSHQNSQNVISMSFLEPIESFLLQTLHHFSMS